MTTTTLDPSLVMFHHPVRVQPTNEWISSNFHAFRILRQAGKSTGVWCLLYRQTNTGLVPAAETLKHLHIGKSEITITFDKPYVVGEVTP
jgi:hypothetical protein